MTTPSDDEIRAARIALDLPVDVALFESEIRALYRAAHAAGLRAGMERAADVIGSLVLEHPGRADLTAIQCEDAIRSAAKGDM